MPQVLKSNSLVESNASDQKESALTKAINSLKENGGHIVPDTSLNKQSALNPRSSLLYSSSKFAVIKAETDIEYARDMLESAQNAVREAERLLHLMIRNHVDTRRTFELAIDALKIEPTAEENLLMGYPGDDEVRS